MGRDIEVQITTCAMRGNLREIETDLQHFVGNLTCEIIRRNASASGLQVSPPIWKINIFRPQSHFTTEEIQKIGVSFEEYSAVYRASDTVAMLRMLEKELRSLGHGYDKLLVEPYSRINKHWEDASYKYVIVMPNRSLISVLEDNSNKHFGIGTSHYIPLGTLACAEPWVFRSETEMIADSVAGKLLHLKGRIYSASAAVIAQSGLFLNF